jgi:hypothetical protein
MRKYYRFSVLLFAAAAIYLTGCSSSKTSTESEEESESTSERESVSETQRGEMIMDAAREEQRNSMYAKANDATILYWLDNMTIHLKNRTKCNIFALNTLYKAGFKTPKTNVLTTDLADTSQFNDIFPVIGISEPGSAKKGDLIAWNGHVIIFDYIVKLKQDLYAMAWWAGTSQKDNGDNIQNNVVYGKYKLNGFFVIRRPVKK